MVKPLQAQYAHITNRSTERRNTMSEENTQTAEAQNTNSNKKKRAEVTIKRQIKTYAVKYLTDLANNDHARTGVYVAPTQEAIAAECKKRWQQHLNRSLPKEDISVYFD